MSVPGRGRRPRLTDFALGARLAVAGGRPSRVRAMMTALGVGLGVAVLLIAASVPSMIDRGDARDNARSTDQALSAKQTRGRGLLIAVSNTTYRGEGIRGRDLQPEPRAGRSVPRPPGVRVIPGPGEMLVSPALRSLLSSERGALLRERLDARVVGTIGDAGLRGPREYSFYRGSDSLGTADGGRALRVTRFGSPGDPEALGPFLTLLVAIAVVVLLLPIAVFVGAAVRFGGEDRDRRLAALRLVGADRAMAARIAAGETLFGAVLGLLAGVAMFFAARPLLEYVSLQDISVFAEELRPAAWLAALIVLVLPVGAVAVSLLALRGVVVEPLGVVRRGPDARRQLWWRLVPAVFGVALIVPLRGELARDGAEYQAGAGVLLVLVGITAVLPWLVEAGVRRLGAGPLSWQLATRRLQMDGGTAARVVSGIAVAVAGAIALQTIFTAAERSSTIPTRGDVTRADVVVRAGSTSGVSAGSLVGGLRATSGVAGATAVATTTARAVGASRVTEIHVGTCAGLRELAHLGRCRDGDVFTVREGYVRYRSGALLVLGEAGSGARPRWRVPAGVRSASARVGPDGVQQAGVLATPGALFEGRLPDARVVAYVKLRPSGRPRCDRARAQLRGRRCPARRRPGDPRTPAARGVHDRAARDLRRGHRGARADRGVATRRRAGAAA